MSFQTHGKGQSLDAYGVFQDRNGSDIVEDGKVFPEGDDIGNVLDKADAELRYFGDFLVRLERITRRKYLFFDRTPTYEKVKTKNGTDTG